MTEKEISELKHNIFNPLAILKGKISLLEDAKQIDVESARKLHSQVDRIVAYIKSLDEN